MFANTYRKTVHTQMQTMRKVLLDSIDHPQKYIKGVENSRVVDYMPDGVVREIRKKGITIREGISVEERKNEFVMTSELMEHPLFMGKVITRIVPASVQNPMSPLDLEVSVELERKTFKATGMLAGEEELIDDIREEMEMLKEKAEEMDRNG